MPKKGDLSLLIQNSNFKFFQSNYFDYLSFCQVKKKHLSVCILYDLAYNFILKDFGGL